MNRDLEKEFKQYSDISAQINKKIPSFQLKEPVVEQIPPEAHLKKKKIDIKKPLSTDKIISVMQSQLALFARKKKKNPKKVFKE